MKINPVLQPDRRMNTRRELLIALGAYVFATSPALRNSKARFGASVSCHCVVGKREGGHRGA